MVESQLSDNVIELTDEVEGDQIGTKNYRFSKIGEPVPIKSDADSEFDQQSPPSHPLAISERHNLIFVAHSTGFCVARTNDVIEFAKNRKSGSSIQQLSVVDVSIGKVSILALSADSSSLAATISGDIHFFDVTALLNQEQKPYFSVSLSDSICIKDMRWTTKFEKQYLLLSSNAKLYYGVDKDPLKDVMDNVDAAEWSVKGKFVAVARKTVLSILSSKFREKLSISLLLKSLIDDSDVNSTIKVDSIRWVRRDCIIVGCFQVDADGKEENYFVQVITSKEGSITKVSNPIVQVFSDVFLGLSDDAVPFASGPHMFLNYLDQSKLAFIANRKNIDQHIVLFGWGLNDNKNEAAMIEILNDAWFPRIDSQDNGDDNLILGISVDKVSQDDSIELVLGDVEREVSPCCILMCVTIDSKLTMFHFFSAADPTANSSTVSDGEEEDTPPTEPSESTLTNISSIADEQIDKIPTMKIQQPPSSERSLVVHPSSNVQTPGESIFGKKEVSPLVNLKTFKGDDNQPKVHTEKPNQEKDVQQFFSGQQSTNVQPFSMKPHHEDMGTGSRNFSKTDAQKVSEAQSGDTPFSGNFLTDKSNQYIRTGSQMGFSSFQNLTSSQASPTVKLTSSETNSDVKSSSLSLSGSAQGNQHLNFNTNLITGDSPGSSYQNSLRLKESTAGLGKIQSLPAVHSSQSLVQENFTPGRSSNYKPHSIKENFRTFSPAVPLNSEPNPSKQSLNVAEMAKELDRLLECIEGQGGFKDTSITLQKSSVVTLEEGISDLSERCRRWKALMDERLGKIQILLDETVQVLARKIYMEGIVKQATDSRYWDYWNLQKLNSELELKHRLIAEVNQDLTNQLIELERHFNTLELNKFGENQVQMSRRAFPSKHCPSRGIQSLHSLRNTMSAQLLAAEQLSECLSKQMTLLSIDKSSKKKENIKKELFETIGIPYDNASFNSPGEKGKYCITASDENCLISTSAFSKERSLKNYQSSAAKSSEPESVRRRRDSLDRNWANFEPPKTTVKRIFLQEDRQKASPNRLSMSTDKLQHTSTRLQEDSTVARAIHSNTSIFSFPSKSNIIQDTPRKYSSENPSTESFKWGDKLQDSSHHLNGKLFSTSSSHSGSQLAIRDFGLTAKEGSSSTHQPHQTPSIPTRLSTQTLDPPKNSSDISISKESGLSKSTFGNVKDHNPPIFAGTFSFDSGKSLKFPASPPPVEPKGEIKSYFSTSISSSSPPTILDSSSASFFPKPTTTAPSPPTTTAAAASIQPSVSSSPASFLSPLKQVPVSTTPPSTNSTTAPPPPTITTAAASIQMPVSSSPASFLSPLKQIAVSTTPPSTNSATKPPAVNTEVPKFSFKKDVNTTTEPQTSSVSKIEPTVPSLPATKPLFTGFSINATAPTTTTTTTTATSGLALSTNQEQQSTVPVVSSTTTTATTTLPSSDVAFTQEDEMEEEAPEIMNQSTQLTLGNNLGSLGLGSTVPSTAPKSNPFGVSFSNNNMQPSSQFTSMIVPSGELFKPASFSFPSPQPAQPAGFGAFSGGFGQQQQQQASGGSGQQALGSVLGSFGQSRQFGTGLPGSGITSAAGGFGGGGGAFGGNQVTGGGFSNAAGGGFASLASAPPGGGFAAAATGGGGFAAAATSGGGFAGAASGGGFGGAGGGGGFGGGFGNQGSGGFSAFGSSGGGAARPPSELFTQIRK